MHRLEPLLAQAIKEVECTQKRMREIKAQRTALYTARPQPIHSPWDRGRNKEVKSADAFALLGLRARLATAYMDSREAVREVERNREIGWLLEEIL